MIMNISIFMICGYIISFIFLNIITYLISSFYSKKFSQPVMRSGFLIAILFLLCTIPLYIIRWNCNEKYIEYAKLLCVICGSFLSSINAVILFKTMRRNR